MIAVRMTQADQERELRQARDFMEVICTIRKIPTTSFALDRCRHESVGETSIWLFGADGKQIASVTRDASELARGHEAWRASLVLKGQVIGQQHFCYLYNALDYASRLR